MDASIDAPPTDSGSKDATDASDASIPDAPVLTDGPLLDATMSSVCDNAGLLAGCVVGACTVSATGKPLPDGASITIQQKPVPADLNGDTLGSVLCSISLSADADAHAIPNLNLSISLTTAPDANAVLFQYMSPSLSRAVPTSQPSGAAVVGLVTAPGDFGATEHPGPWSVQSDIGLDMRSSADQASLLRNLSAQPMYDAYYDGSHLFVCNGSRLLVYNGIPANPSVKPSFVLGQPDIDTISAQTSSSLFGNSGCVTVWSDAMRLAVANGNRVLLWNALPSASLSPADLVLGQPDFSSNIPNNGGVAATSLYSPQNIDSNGTQFAVADMFNNRVLIWNHFPVSIAQPADFVVAQPNFSTNGIGTGAISVYEVFGVAFDPAGMFLTSVLGGLGIGHVAPVTTSNPSTDFIALPAGNALVPTNLNPSPARIARTPNGGLAIRSYEYERVVMLKKVPTGPSSIDFVLGQPDPMHVVQNLVGASVVAPQYPGAATGLGGGASVLVPDENRLLIFDTPPTYNFEPASRVLGQAGFTTNGPTDYRGISASTLGGPADVAVAGGIVAVADRGNNRVLIYHATDLAAHNATASVVLGQPDATSYVPNVDQQTPSATTMSGPGGVALDGTHLIVSDTENHRVLIWNSVPSSTATAADLVLGQSGFSGRRPNNGRGDNNADGYSDANADGFFYPTGVASDGTHLFVADRLNNRVLVWSTFPTSNGQAADAVIGQANFTDSQPNKNFGPFKFAADGLNLPTGVTLAGTSLWIADTENNRIVRWDNASTSARAPTAWIGQPSGTMVTNLNYKLDTDVNAGEPNPIPAPTAGSSLRPRGIALVGGTLYVTESDSNRVHFLDATSFVSVGQLGQSSDTAGSANANGIGASSLATPLGLASDGSTLWVADSANNRVLGYDVTTRPSSGAAATTALGQPGLLTNGFNQTSTAANGATSQPHGLALANGKLYIADTNHHRVLVMQTPVTTGSQPVQVYGQPNPTLALPNSGGAPSASTLAGPQGIFADKTHLMIADTANNRVLVYDPNATGNAATLVLGQTGFTTTAANSGGASASTMQAPTAVFSDGTSLWISDTGNHRVLVWNAFPTANGQAADLVIGQTSFSGVLPNQGNAAASASSLSFPTGIVSINNAFYIADTANNRVLAFSKAPTTSGANADGVLGQADLVSRTAGVAADDLTRLAGPVYLAEDGENLYVVDRDLGRVVVYAVGTLKSSQTASFDLAARGGLSLASPQGIAVERTPFFTSRLYVGDTGHNQVAVMQSVSRLAAQ
jgi:sugar lactone lactonase YvrE